MARLFIELTDSLQSASGRHDDNIDACALLAADLLCAARHLCIGAHRGTYSLNVDHSKSVVSYSNQEHNSGCQQTRWG